MPYSYINPEMSRYRVLRFLGHQGANCHAFCLDTVEGPFVMGLPSSRKFITAPGNLTTHRRRYYRAVLDEILFWEPVDQDVGKFIFAPTPANPAVQEEAESGCLILELPPPKSPESAREPAPETIKRKPVEVGIPME